LKDVLESFDGRYRNLLDIFEAPAVETGRSVGAPYCRKRSATAPQRQALIDDHTGHVILEHGNC
jgi:hypothetical protein